MQAYKCDRCGKYFDVLGDGEIYYVVEQKADDTWERHDLCPRCAEDFRKWIKKHPRKKKIAPEYNPSLNGGFVFEEVG